MEGRRTWHRPGRRKWAAFLAPSLLAVWLSGPEAFAALAGRTALRALDETQTSSDAPVTSVLVVGAEDGSVKADTETPGGGKRRSKIPPSVYPCPFPPVLVNLAEDVLEERYKLSDAIREHLTRDKACDIIFKNPESLGFLPLTVSKFRITDPVIFSPLSRTFANQSRIRAFVGRPIVSEKPPEDMKVGASTDPVRLAQSMQNSAGLVPNGTRDFGRTMLLRVQGKNASTVALQAIEELYFRSQNEVQFSITAKREGPGVELQFLVALAGSRVEVEDKDLQEAESEEGEEGRRGLNKLLKSYGRPTLFPTFSAGNRTNAALSVAISRMLEVATVDAVDVILVDKSARALLLRALASIADWIRPACTVVGRRQGRLVVRVVKAANWLPRIEAAEVFKIANTTDPDNLAAAMRAKLNRYGNAILIGSVRPDAREKAMIAIEKLHWQMRREIAFKPAWVEEVNSNGQKKLSMTILVTQT